MYAIVDIPLLSAYPEDIGFVTTFRKRNYIERHNIDEGVGAVLSQEDLRNVHCALVGDLDNRGNFSVGCT